MSNGCRGLSIADQQIVEIAKALSLDARVIVMDEPTAALSAAEVAGLFEVVRALIRATQPLRRFEPAGDPRAWAAARRLTAAGAQAGSSTCNEGA